MASVPLRPNNKLSQPRLLPLSLPLPLPPQASVSQPLELQANSSQPSQLQTNSSQPPQLQTNSSQSPQLQTNSSQPPQLQAQPPQLQAQPPQFQGQPPQLQPQPPQLQSQPPQLQEQPPQLQAQPEESFQIPDMESDDIETENDGHTVSFRIRGKNGEPTRTISYMAEDILGSGSFGVVFKAKCLETGEIVAIKKVMQDGRYKCRELHIMRQLNHPNVVSFKNSFFSKSRRDELFLNLVMEYLPLSLSRLIEHYNSVKEKIPLIYVKLYAYQIFKGLAYIHTVPRICHRDLKPQNILVNPFTHEVKLCDFGSAKVLVKGEANISYICSRFYRAPELLFGATEYTTSIDIWSAGCVLAELILGQPLFPGASQVEQLVEIVKILGSPTREEIRCMNPTQSTLRFPDIKGHPWHKIFEKRMPPEAIDLASRLLQYAPHLRCSALVACAHPFFDELRDPDIQLPDGCPPPQLFEFKDELAGAPPELIEKLIPEHIRHPTVLEDLHPVDT